MKVGDVIIALEKVLRHAVQVGPHGCWELPVWAEDKLEQYVPPKCWGQGEWPAPIQGERDGMKNAHTYFADQISTMGDFMAEKGQIDDAKLVWSIGLLLHYKMAAPDCYKAAARAARLQLLIALKRHPDMLKHSARDFIEEGFGFDEEDTP